MSGPRRRLRSQGTHPAGLSPRSKTRVLLCLAVLVSTLYLCSRRRGPVTLGEVAPPFGPSHGEDIDDYIPHDQNPRVNAGGAEESVAQLNGIERGALDYIELQCEDGKPPDVDLSYWKDISQDKAYESPWGAAARKTRSEGKRQYVTFEPDGGGFNNIRMAMETILVFARETGRTLVIPPAQRFYLVNRPAVSFADMFPVEYLEDYMDIMTMEEFLEKEGITGVLGEKPPGNKISGHKPGELHQYLRGVADYRPHWHNMEEALVFGPSPENPSIPGDEESQAWLAKFLTNKRREFGYTEEMQRARHIHFQSSGPKDGERQYRIFTHFYTFLGFIDPTAARHHRRLVRDVVHFREWLFCASATIVGRLRAAGGGTPGRWSGYYGEWGGLGVGETGDAGGAESEAGTGEGMRREAGFSTFHIRRGDFQYKEMKPPAGTIQQATADLIRPSEVLYIATDEKNKEFFDPLAQDRRVYYLDDFKDVLEGIDPSYYLMIDTIVASQGRTFIGTWRSTFTGYITRLRGYYRFPTEFSWYFWDNSKQQFLPTNLAQDSTPRDPFFMREWPTAWEDIDQDLLA